MKKKSSQSAFFNLRVLIGLFVVLAGVFLALAGFGTFSALAQAKQKQKIITNSTDPLVPNGFDCSKIEQLGIDRQENMRAGAIMIACGRAQGGFSSVFETVHQAIQQTLAPLAFGAGDVNLITGAETSPDITQSETYSLANPDNSNQILVTYNDSRGRFVNPINISGASVSTDGGNTFTRITCANNTPPCQVGQSPFSNTLGDPVTLYNKPTGTWFAIYLDVACGGQGIGGYKSTNPSDPNSWTHFCVHNNSGDDRESGWSDNNTSSSFFGRMYVSWNDFNVGGGALFVRVSTDNGNTWTAHQVTSSFVRDVQITGDSATGDVYVAGMNEGGGGTTGPRSNKIYRSTDGGNTWTNTYTGPNFTGPSDNSTCTSNSYFATMFTGYWRHMGWGEPAAFNQVVHLVYAQHGAGADAGDVYYIRSTDRGATFGAPLKLNTDATTRPQWQPNLSVSPAGTLFAVWYDGRESTTCTKGNPAVPCYRMWGRKSNDNGLTWLADDMFSDVVTPLPGQPDPGIVDCYAGDYDYGSAILTKHVSTWVDGRVTIGGQSQQDAFTDRELVGFAVTTTVPACGSVISTQPTDFVVNLSDPALPSSVQASDFTVNNIPANSFTLSNGNATITFHFTTSPVVTQGPQTMHIAAGAILRASDSMPIFEFTCDFRYDATLLQVTTTVPPVGGTFSPPAPGTYTYDVNFNEAVDPTSVQASDLTVSGNSGPSVTGVSVINGNTTAEFTLHMNNGGDLTASIAAGAITDQFGNPGAAFSGDYTVLGPQPCMWSAGASLPSVGVRLVGVFFPANGKFYAMGGRSSDSAGSEFTHPFEYDPNTNTWTTKAATYPDNMVNNMACGVLTDAGTPYIYCAGGSVVATPTVTTGRVFRYNPVTDTISPVAAPWPAAGTTVLPGGFTVLSNKLYILGGFDTVTGGGQGINQIWEFTPSPAAWVQKPTVLPVPLGYIPTTTIGTLIYTGGGSDITAGVLTDTTNSFVYNPVANTIGTIAAIPRATGETRALDFCNLMYVMGGGRTAPNPSNEVDIYDPGSNTWSAGTPFVIARRNFPTDTDGTSRIWLAGGYAPTAPTDSMEIFNCPESPCATPTPTPTPTATPTPTPGRIHLTANENRVHGTLVVHLRWTGANTSSVKIFRNGALLARVPNTGSYTDTLTVHGTYTYQVCEVGTGNCSNEVRVIFGR